ncbi:MAG TPA: hypothetical protein VGE08_16890 [Steroidobacter sp.]
MTELAITALRPRDLEWTAETRDRRASRWRKILGDSPLADWLAGFSPTHLYVGSELCEELLPSRRTVRTAIDCATGRGLQIALLTPISSPGAIRQLADLLPLLPDGTEVIVNDWGVAYFAREHFPALVLVAGRLLCKMIRDPRLPGTEWAPHCAHSLDSEHLQRTFRLAGFRRLEIDVPPFATAESFSRLPLPAGVHVPFAVVAKGRMCRIGSMSRQGPERFAPGRRCRKECLHVSATMTRPAAVDSYRTVQLGNTIMSQHSRGMLDAVATAVADGRITRLIAPVEPL